MAHIAQERYSTLVDEKLRNTLVTKDNLIFNTRYEGNPKAGKVKVPVRDTEVEVKQYDKQNGAAISTGSTTYFDINIDIDEAVNEMIDGYDAASVPDGITAVWTVPAILWGCPWTPSLSVLWRRPPASPWQRPRLPAPTARHTSRYWRQSVCSPVWVSPMTANAGCWHLRNLWRCC